MVLSSVSIPNNVSLLNPLLFPLTANVRVAVTTSVVSTSVTVNEPDVVNAASVSLMETVSGPSVIDGGSLA